MVGKRHSLKSAEECKSGQATLLGKLDKEFNDRSDYLGPFLRDLLFCLVPRVFVDQTWPGGGIFTETAIQVAGTAFLRAARLSAAGIMADPGRGSCRGGRRHGACGLSPFWESGEECRQDLKAA